MEGDINRTPATAASAVTLAVGVFATNNLERCQGVQHAKWVWFT